MAENFASFDYKTQEEVLTVLKYLTSVLSTTGMQLVEALSPAHLLKQLHESSQPETQVRRARARLSIYDQACKQVGNPAPPAFTPEGEKTGSCILRLKLTALLHSCRVLRASAISSKLCNYCYYYDA